MSSNVQSRHPLVVLSLTAAWFIGLIIAAVLVAYIPGALKLVNDERRGRLMARVMLPALLPLFAASVQFARRKYVSALILAGLVFAVLLGLDGYAIAFVMRR